MEFSFPSRVAKPRKWNSKLIECSGACLERSDLGLPILAISAYWYLCGLKFAVHSVLATEAMLPHNFFWLVSAILRL